VRGRLVLGLNLLAGVFLLAWLLKFYGGPAVALLAAAPSLPFLAALLFAIGSSVALLAWRWGYLLAGLCEPPSLLRLTLYRSASHGVAVLIPSGKLGGDPLRIWLAARGGVEAGPSIASVATDRALEIGSTAPFSILFGTLLLQQGLPQIERALVTVLLATFGLAIGVGIAARRLRSGAGLVTALARSTRLDRLRAVDSKMDILEAADRAGATLVRQPARMLVGFALGILSNLLVMAEFALLLLAFDLPCTPITVVGAIFATAGAHMLPIPGGIGVLEAAQMWMFGALGYPPDVGLAAGLAVRLRELIWMLPGLLYLLGRSLARSRSGISAA
jgi:uncharacterized protein (TIRG00374 family)